VSEVDQKTYDEFNKLSDQLASALDNRDEDGVVQIMAQIEAFAKTNNIDLTQPVTLATPNPITVHADQTGVDGNKTFKVAALTAGKVAAGSDVNFAVDGKASTAAKVSDFLQVDLGGVGSIRTVALKLAETTPLTFKFLTSFDGTKWDEVPMGAATSDVVSNNWDYFIFPGNKAAKFAKIECAGKEFAVTTLQLLETIPKDVDPTVCEKGFHKDATGKCVPDDVVPPPPPPPAGDIPMPAGFKALGPVSKTWVFWGRTTTNYSSGGSGPSLRWDDEGTQSYNLVAGYEFNLGTKHGKRGDDNIDLKTTGNSHSDGKGGWYLPFIDWKGDGSAAFSGCGKEYPHPDTTHEKWNVEDKKVPLIIKDGNWHAILVAKYLDKAGVPTIMAWFNQNATGKMEDYVYLGKSKDTGNMKPGPILTKIAQKGGGKQSLQARMDEVPDAKFRNGFSVGVIPPD
jgi:hypothetical protein